MDPIRLYVVKGPNGTAVTEAATLAAVGLDTDEKVEAAFPGKGHWVEIWLKEATFQRQQEIRRRCRVKTEGDMFEYDPLREPAARCAVMVERWNGMPASPSEEAFENLPATLGNIIDSVISAFMYPSMVNEPNFIEAWKQSQAVSAPVSQSE